MAANRDLRPQLDERLQGALKMRLAQYGLAVVQVDTLALRHDKFDANRARVGSLWLVADDRRVQVEHAMQLDQLYNEQEWQAIWREEQAVRPAAGARNCARTRASPPPSKPWPAPSACRRCAREIELYGRIVDSKNRKQALERGADEIVAELEHELAKKGAAREDESTQWAHLRRLAEIHMRTELEIAQQGASEARQMAQQRFSHQLLQQQIENKISQALGIEDEARKRAELVRLHQKQQDAARREREIEDEHHQARWQALALTNAAHKREAARVAEWEDQLALDRQRELLRADAVKDAAKQGRGRADHPENRRHAAHRRPGRIDRPVRKAAAHDRGGRHPCAPDPADRARRRAAPPCAAPAGAGSGLAAGAAPHGPRPRREIRPARARDRAGPHRDRAPESIGAMSDTAKVALAAPECGRPGRCAENPGPRLA
ncbi:hypothetical protein LP420_01855 [Massilia sp. B-10]|nr:hypothetical protein LP420_01855 [Massilia sp. B-10]